MYYSKKKLSYGKLLYLILCVITLPLVFLYYRLSYVQMHAKQEAYTQELNLHQLLKYSWYISDNPLKKYQMDETGIVKNSIAVGLAITSKKCRWKNIPEIKKSFPFFNSLMPTFCKTASGGYHYNIFLSFDKNDPFYTNEDNLFIVQTLFNDYANEHCPIHSNYTIHFVYCNHNKQPARAQNDAMMVAYMNNMEYYYRINDDTEMESSKWTELFVNQLKSFNPPLVGVVGPNHTGGLESFLTYDFVHYTHIHIHGYYYPRFMTDWFADVWISKVYEPGRSVKLKSALLKHTRKYEQRYEGNRDPGMENKTIQCIASGQKLVERYCRKSHGNSNIKGQTNILSFSLSGNRIRENHGAIRNVQLWHIFYPKWKLRIYMLNPVIHYSYKEPVPRYVIRKLQQLGAEIVFLDKKFVHIDYHLWKYLAADDSENFVVRQNDQRLSDYDFTLINDWLKGSHVKPFFSPSCNETTVKENPFFGAKSYELKKILGGSVKKFLFSFAKKREKLYDNYQLQGEELMNKVILRKINRFSDQIRYGSNLGLYLNEFEEEIKGL